MQPNPSTQSAKVFGIGVDILEIDRIKRIYLKHGEQFAQKILGEQELLDFQKRQQQRRERAVSYLATRFAAKEAFVKALGVGMRDPFTWTGIQVVSSVLGKPSVKLTPPLKQWCLDAGAGNIHLSLSDSALQAIAYVMIEKLDSLHM